MNLGGSTERENAGLLYHLDFGGENRPWRTLVVLFEHPVTSFLIFFYLTFLVELCISRAQSLLKLILHKGWLLESYKNCAGIYLVQN